jgi:hypothetical protein
MNGITDSTHRCEELTMSRTSRAAGPDLSTQLGQRRWIRRARPFPHFIAYQVFAPAVYDSLEQSFQKLLEESLDGPYMEKHDIHGRTVDNDLAHHFEPLVSRAFHDVLAEVVGLDATGHMAVGMHHHRIGGKHGFPHNDLNPGWFLGDPPPGALTLSGQDIDYTSGTPLTGDVTEPAVETIRAASVLFYLANPPWEPGDGGATGLYRSGADPIEKPVAFVPPINNSMLLFECTPTSYHGFIGACRNPRNSIVMWLHRRKRDVVERWGKDAIVPYGLVPNRRAAR